MNREIESLQQQTIEAKRLVYYLLRKMLRTEFYSQATQDIFVTKILANKRKGFYLEIGGGHPSDSNNTYLLERQYQWTGLSLEYDNELVNIYITQLESIKPSKPTLLILITQDIWRQ